LILGLINLIPIPPLDGSRVLSGLLPDYWSWQFNRLERYGLLIVLVLLWTNALSFILAYPMFFASKLFFSLAGL
jgi:Zn-dependent protease